MCVHFAYFSLTGADSTLQGEGIKMFPRPHSAASTIAPSSIPNFKSCFLSETYGWRPPADKGPQHHTRWQFDMTWFQLLSWQGATHRGHLEWQSLDSASCLLSHSSHICLCTLLSLYTLRTRQLVTFMYSILENFICGSCDGFSFFIYSRAACMAIRRIHKELGWLKQS